MAIRSYGKKLTFKYLKRKNMIEVKVLGSAGSNQIHLHPVSYGLFLTPNAGSPKLLMVI